MSTVLHIAALVVAVVSVPSVAGITAWGLTGGDGPAENPMLGFLGIVVGVGSIYNVIICWRSFWFFADWQWWLMWAPAAAGLLGILLAGAGEKSKEQSWGGVVVGLGMQLMLGVPAALLWAAGVVTP